MNNEVLQFEEFFRQFYEREFLEAAREGRKAISVDFSLLDKFDPNLADKLLNDPRNILEAAGLAVQGLDFPEENVKIVPHFFNLPENILIKHNMIGVEHIGKLICIEEMLRSKKQKIAICTSAIFSCPDCGNKISVEQNEKYIKPPAYCDNDSCGYKGKFDLVNQKFEDYRELRVGMGEPIRVDLRGALAFIDICNEGDLARISGIVEVYKEGNSNHSNFYIDANDINVIAPVPAYIKDVKIDEKALKDFLWFYPNVLGEEGLIPWRREEPVEGGAIDIVFLDKDRNHVITEVKLPENDEGSRGKHLPQIVRYYGGYLLKHPELKGKIRKMVISAEVPAGIKISLKDHEIEFKLINDVIMFFVGIHKGMIYGANSFGYTAPIPIKELLKRFVDSRYYEPLIPFSENMESISKAWDISKEQLKKAAEELKSEDETLKELFLDSEEKIDMDGVIGIMPSSQRQKIHQITDIIERLSKTIGRRIPREEILAVAQDEGIKEDEADDILNRLKREGIIFCPEQGFVQKI